MTTPVDLRSNATAVQTAGPNARPEKVFEQIFGGPSRLYRAPGRVNLIGEHTDYNQGFVMPAAIGLYCWVAIAARGDRRLQVYSSEFEATVSVELDDKTLSRRGDWSDYVVGTALALENSGHKLSGANIVIRGQVPIGSGLSSSAAIEVSTGYALLDVSGARIDLKQLALDCRQAENEFVGARVGIMDQFISAHGRAGHALLLDCRSLESKALPIPPGRAAGDLQYGSETPTSGRRVQRASRAMRGRSAEAFIRSARNPGFARCHPIPTRAV